MSLGQYQNTLQTGEVTIAINASLSGALDLWGCELVAIQMSGVWTAAGLTFQGSNDGTTYGNVYDDAGNEVALTVDALQYITFDQDIRANLSGIRWIKVRSGTVALPVNQLLAARVLTLVAAG